MPSSHRYADDWCGPYMGFEHVELAQLGHNYWLPERPPGGMHYERWYHRDGLRDLKDRLYGQQLAPLARAAQTHSSALPPVWHNSTWVGDRGVAYLQAQARNQKAGTAKPFCAWLSFADPPHGKRDLHRRPWWHRAALENEPQGPNRKVREEYSRMAPQTDTQLREIIANYYGMISLIDHQVGRLLQTLHDEGLADYAQSANPAAAHSRSLRPLIEQADGQRDHALTEWRLGAQRCGVALDLRGVRTRNAKLTLELGSGAGELYDLREDPH